MSQSDHEKYKPPTPSAGDGDGRPDVAGQYHENFERHLAHSARYARRGTD